MEEVAVFLQERLIELLLLSGVCDCGWFWAMLFWNCFVHFETMLVLQSRFCGDYDPMMFEVLFFLLLEEDFGPQLIHCCTGLCDYVYIYHYFSVCECFLMTGGHTQGRG